MENKVDIHKIIDYFIFHNNIARKKSDEDIDGDYDETYYLTRSKLQTLCFITECLYMALTGKILTGEAFYSSANSPYCKTIKERFKDYDTWQGAFFEVEKPTFSTEVTRLLDEIVKDLLPLCEHELGYHIYETPSYFDERKGFGVFESSKEPMDIKKVSKDFANWLD